MIIIVIATAPIEEAFERFTCSWFHPLWLFSVAVIIIIITFSIIRIIIAATVKNLWNASINGVVFACCLMLRQLSASLPLMSSSLTQYLQDLGHLSRM